MKRILTILLTLLVTALALCQIPVMAEPVSAENAFDTPAVVATAAATEKAAPVSAAASQEEDAKTKISAVGAWLNTTFADFDYKVFTLFSKLHRDWLTPVIHYLTMLGDSPFVPVLLVFAIIMFMWKKNRRWAMALFFAIIIGTLVTNVIVKPLIARPRPYVSLANDPQFMQWYMEAGAEIESDKSFPSGHTTAAFEIGITLMLAVRNKGIKWLFPLYSIFIACTRLYLCVHYCTDVIGGMLIGICAGVLAYCISRSLMSWMEESEGGLGRRLNDFDLGGKRKKKIQAEPLEADAEPLEE